MLLFTSVLVFGIPLLIYLLQIRQDEKKREDRISEIRQTLHDKEKNRVEQKWKRIKEKKSDL